MTTLNLASFGRSNIDITKSMVYASQLCKDNANFDLDCASILENLLNASYSSKYSIVKQQFYKQLAINSCYYFAGIPLKNNQLTPWQQVQFVQDYIGWVRTDAKKTSQLAATFKNILDMEQVNLDFFAVLFFTLENKLYELKTYDGVQSDIDLYEKLVSVIKPYILDQSPELNKLYFICQSHLNIKYQGLLKNIEVTLNSDLLNNFINAWNKINNRVKNISERLSTTFNYPEADDYFKQIPDFVTQTVTKENQCFFNNLPDCYSINSHNYHSYKFSAFYALVVWYKDLSKKLQDLKKYQAEELKQEIELLQKEAEAAILQAQKLTDKNRGYIRQKPYLPLTIPVDLLNNKDNWEDVLNNLNKKCLKYLDQLFNFHKDNKLKFSEVKCLISSLGGKMETFDGSKTRILLPGIHTVRLIGGLHKPHSGDLLNWVHSRLIVKALQRAGITATLANHLLEEQKLAANVSPKKSPANVFGIASKLKLR